MRKILSKNTILLLILGCVSITSTYGQRVITMKNFCDEPVWFGFAGGSVRNKNSQDTKCGGDGDCFQGSKCIQTGPLNQCFFVNPKPEDGNFKLNKGEARDVNIPVFDNGLDQIWSGAITGRTKYDEQTKQFATADCGDDGFGNCKPSQGFQQPATQAEMTFAKQFIDFYDVEIINGVHIGVSMGPSNQPGSTSSPYDCGNPGSKYPMTPMIGACDWNLSPPLNDYNWVTKGGKACAADSECTNNEICGISFNPGFAQLLQKTCGSLLGYWSADQICGIIPNYGAPFNCNQRLPAPQDGLTNWNLFACVGMGSCYQQGADSTCCGCANWNEDGVQVPPDPYTENCKNKNPAWTNIVKPSLLWLKKACPSAYTYPYDDMSSTFTCRKMQNNVNSVNYQIAFCPQNENRADDNNSVLFME